MLVSHQPNPLPSAAGLRITRPHRVAVLAYAGMAPFELGCVVEVFGLPRPELDINGYEVIVCAETADPLPVVGGFSITAAHGLDELTAADTVVIPGANVHSETSAALIEALRLAASRGARMVSICSGAFTLGAAGLLDGRRAATHWRYADLLQKRHPAVAVTADVLYIDEGSVVTSAGSAAGLDMLLHLVRTDHGAQVANTYARRLVLPPHRDGGQAQFIELPVRDVVDDDGVARSMAWALDHLTEPVTVAGLAAQARMSQRSYLRHFAKQTGSSPIRWLIERRVAASLPLLETSTAPVERVATAVGFDSAVTFRHHFARCMHTSPSAYRRAFRATTPATTPGATL